LLKKNYILQTIRDLNDALLPRTSENEKK